MFKQRYFVRCTVSLAVLAACFVAASAQAGPLGLGGSAGGGLSGGAAPRHLDVAGQAGAHVRRDGALPRGDQARETAGAATGAAVSKAVETKALAGDKAAEAKAGATATGGAAKGAALDKASDAKAAAAAASKTSVTGSAQAGGSTRGADASAGGSTRASSDSGAPNVKASTHASTRR